MFSEMGTRFLAWNWKSLESYLNMVFAEQQLSLSTVNFFSEGWKL